LGGHETGKSFLTDASAPGLGYNNIDNDYRDRDRSLLQDASISVIESYKTLPQAFTEGGKVQAI
jgi:hypothetical protein